MTYIIGCLGAGLLLMGIVFTIIAVVSSNKNNDMMDVATVGYSFAFICANVVVEELKVDIDDVSVAFEEVNRSDWGEQVYKKEIRDNENIYHKPNYEYK